MRFNASLARQSQNAASIAPAHAATTLASKEPGSRQPESLLAHGGRWHTRARGINMCLPRERFLRSQAVEPRVDILVLTSLENPREPAVTEQPCLLSL
jgi:hypothetical protein